MQGRIDRLVCGVLVVSTGFLLLLGAPATGPAQSPDLGTLKEKSAALAAQSHQVLVQLYALESRLQHARADLAEIDAQAAVLDRQRESARRRYRAARQTMDSAQRQLGRQLRILYEQDQLDPIAVVLGATSLAEAIEGLDRLGRTARATESVLERARASRAVVADAQRRLAVQVAGTRAARAAVAAIAAGLERARSERGTYLASLRAAEELTASQIASLERSAQLAQRRAQLVARQAVARREAPQAVAAPAAEPAAAAAAAPADPPTDPGTPPPAPAETVTQGIPSAPAATAPPRPGGSMSVLATGYCLRGSTATGLPVGPGIVAVDPTVIPLGSRMTIPGYGEGVAADTGNDLSGARIDVWMASCAEARSFSRTVRITFH